MSQVGIIYDRGLDLTMITSTGNQYNSEHALHCDCTVAGISGNCAWLANYPDYKLFPCALHIL